MTKRYSRREFLIAGAATAGLGMLNASGRGGLGAFTPENPKLYPLVEATQRNDLATRFLSPPDSAKPYTWWHWLNGHLSKEGITLDLEAMKRVGINGFHIFQIGEEYIDEGPVHYGSPEHFNMLRHAAAEANRLGLEFGMHNCPGWSSSGGPWITPELSMQVLSWSEAELEGGVNVNVALPQPASHLNYYRDAFVLAFPTPANGTKQIPDWRSKVNFPAVRTGIKHYGPMSVPRGGSPPPPGPFPTGESVVVPESVIDLSDKVDEHGQLYWNAPVGKWTVLRIGYTTTQEMNAPAPTGATGLECDKFNRAALDFHFRHVFTEEMFTVLSPFVRRKALSAIIDSYEKGRQNWTSTFPEEFAKRNGYDLRHYLPAMTGRVVDSLEISERFLWDVRKTHANLLAENYYGYFAELCHLHGINCYIESYGGGPFDDLTVGARADVPMCEFFQGEPPHETIKLAASIGHLNGKQVIGAESFTSQSKWTESPSALKAVGDQAFALGINRVFLHTFTMQPNRYALPGLAWKYGGYFNRNNTWFEQGKSWLEYLTRCQYLLQQGNCVNDLLYFGGENSPVHIKTVSVEPAPPAGYGFDIADANTIQKQLKIEKGRIVLANGMSYVALVLPAQKTMTLQLLRAIHNLVHLGMQLVVGGSPPENTPGLKDYRDSDIELRRLANELWGNLNGTTVREWTFGEGRVHWDQSLSRILGKLNVEPDFEFSSRSGTAAINASHRRVGGSDVYFVSNRGQQWEELICSFRVAGKQPEFWDATNGERTPALIYEVVDQRTTLPLQLEPSGSIFVVFQSRPQARRLECLMKDGRVVQGVRPFQMPQSTDLKPTTKAPLSQPEDPPPVELCGAAESQVLIWQTGEYSWCDSAGRISTKQVSGIAPPVKVTGPWEVTFPANLGAPPQITLDKLISWSEHSNKGVKYFSGTATYKKRFTVAAIEHQQRLFLDLGRVQVLAEVVVNGKTLGVLWKTPFRVDITDAMRVGENELEIRVTNTWPNRLIGDEQLPEENEYGHKRITEAIDNVPAWFDKGEPKPPGERITFVTWRDWQADSPLQEAGLLGPVQLRTAVRLALS